MDDDATIANEPSAPLGMAYLPVVPNEDWEEIEGMSYAHAAIINYLHANNYQHPLYNLERKRNELLVTSPNSDLEWESEYISPL